MNKNSEAHRPLRQAEMIDTVSCGGRLVSTVKLARVWPSGTSTSGGTMAYVGLLERSLTRAPSCRAGSERITVPVEGLPPTTVIGTRVTRSGMGGGVPQTFGVPAPPQICGSAQVPQA